MQLDAEASLDKESRVNANNITGNRIGSKRFALDTIASASAYLVASDTAEASSTVDTINATGHSAKVGDFIQFTSGNLTGQTVGIETVSTDSFTLSQSLTEAPGLGDGFDILRIVFLRISSTGAVTVVAGSGWDTSGLALETGGNLAAAATSLALLDNAVAGSELQVDIVASLPAGTNGIGKLTSNSGVDIGDVTINNTTGANAVNIQDGGNTITVDGTVAANAGTGWVDGILSGASLTGVYGLGCLVSASGNAAWLTQPVTNTELRAAAVPVAGFIAEGQAYSGNPLLCGGVDWSSNNTVFMHVEEGDGSIRAQVTSSALPTGAATSANQINGGQKTQIVDAAGSVLDLWHQGDVWTGAAAHSIAIMAVTDEGSPKMYPLVLELSENDGESNTRNRLAVEATQHYYNGSTWDRARGDTTSGAWVQVKAALPAGTNAIGKLAANSGVDIGDVDVTSQPARAATTDTITAKLATDAIQNGTTALTPKFAAIDVASSGDNTLVAAVVGKKVRVLACVLVASAAVTVRFESGAGGTALTGQMVLAANGGFTLPFNPVGWFETGSNTLLNLELSAATSVDGCLTYVEV